MKDIRDSSAPARRGEIAGGSLDVLGRRALAGRRTLAGRGMFVLAACFGLVAGVVACESSTEAPQGPQLVLTTDTTAYRVGDVGALTVVNQDTMLIRHRSLSCGAVERLESGRWEALGRVHETWNITSPNEAQACGFLTQGFNNLEPGEEATEDFEIRAFMAEEGTYRISIWETEEERVFLTEEFTVEAAEDPPAAEAARIRAGSPRR